MKLPSFFCVGAQKSGTTTLHDILIQHPKICLPEEKETKFFQDNEKYKKGLEFYIKRYFSNCTEKQILGEIDPEYIFFDYVPQRIYKDIGKNVKLIFMFRNPIDRAYSHYWMSVRRGYEDKSFEEAIKLEKERIRKDQNFRRYFSYISRGLYAKQVKNYLKYFPKENMFFIIFEEDFLKNRKKTISNLFRFLDIEDLSDKLNVDLKSNPASLPKSKIIRDILYKPLLVRKIAKAVVPNEKIRLKLRKFLENINQKPFKPPKLDPNLRKQILEEYFMEDIEELSNIIDRDLKNIWYK